MRDGMRLLFESSEDGFAVIADASDGRSAVRAVEQHRPDVVVMDVSMPDLNGIDATAQIRAVSPRTRVVALSAHQDPRMVVEMLRAGARAYVLKETAFDEVLRAIRSVLAGRVYLSPAVAGHVVERAIGPEGPDEPSRALLTAREREVLQLLAEGQSIKDTAARLCVSAKTVETHRKQIMDKLGIRTIAGLTKWALRAGLTSAE